MKIIGAAKILSNKEKGGLKEHLLSPCPPNTFTFE